MPIQSKKQKRIINILSDLPPEKIDEVIDFAKYLKIRQEPLQKAKKKVLYLTVPTFHLGRIEKEATERNKLYREYLDCKVN